MSVRVRFKFVLSISSDSNESKDLGMLTSEVVSDALNEGGAWKTVIEKETSDQLLNMPNIEEISFLAIRTTSIDPTLSPVDIIIKKDSTGGEEITISPLGPTSTNPKEGWMIITTSGVTAIYASNESTTTDMNITVFACG